MSQMGTAHQTFDLSLGGAVPHVERVLEIAQHVPPRIQSHYDSMRNYLVNPDRGDMELACLQAHAFLEGMRTAVPAHEGLEAIEHHVDLGLTALRPIAKQYGVDF